MPTAMHPASARTITVHGRAPLRLIGIDYCGVEIPEGAGVAPCTITVNVPTGTQEAYVAISGVRLSFGTPDAELEGKLGSVLFQAQKQPVTGSTFQIDVLAFLGKANIPVNWSGDIGLEIMCFG